MEEKDEMKKLEEINNISIFRFSIFSHLLTKNYVVSSQGAVHLFALVASQ